MLVCACDKLSPIIYRGFFMYKIAEKDVSPYDAVGGVGIGSNLIGSL